MILYFITQSPSWANPWTLKGPDGQDSSTVIEVGSIFKKAPSGWAYGINIQDPNALLEGSKSTLRYIRQNKENDSRGIQPGMLSEYGITVDQVEWTLSLLAQTARRNPERLKDAKWIEGNFDLYLWTPDAHIKDESPKDKIRLTKYVVYEVDGSHTRSSEYPHALWAVPNDEVSMSDTEADHFVSGIRNRLTRQDILDGALLDEYAGSARPLVWLSRKNIHEAIMQGTISVRVESGDIKWFNVHRCNNHPYIHGQSSEDQKRYWYFREVESPMGWGWTSQNKIGLFPYASVAGDVDNFGLGKVFWLQDERTVRLVILSDTGGAFQPNLHQLDWFIGVVKNKSELRKRSAQMPAFVTAGILIAK